MPKILFLLKGKDFHHKEGNRDAQNCGDDVADNGREAQPVEENQYDYVLDKVVWYIGNSKAYILSHSHGRGEYQLAVQPVGNDISYDISNVKIQIVPRADEFQNPGKKNTVKGIYAAHHQEHNKGPVKKMMMYF